MKKFVFSFFLVLGFAISGCPQTSSNVTFTFTAVGDDGHIGQASYYDIRYATDTLSLIDWTEALQVGGEPAPKMSGEAESFVLPIDGLESGIVYYFAIRVGDEEYNWSGNSNTVMITAPDWNVPAVIMNFEVKF